MGSGECSTECPYIKDGKGRHCLTHPIPGGSVDGKCCGCGITREELAKPVTPKNADHRCRCGHIKYAHEESQGRCGVGRNGTCGCQVFVCDHSRCGWKPREECQHPDKQFTGSLYDGPGGRKSWLYYTCPDCKAKWREEKPEQCDHPDNDPCDRCLPGEPREQKPKSCTCGPSGACDTCDPDEPPLTPEEEEQAPEDEGGACQHTGADSPCDWNVCRQKPEPLPPPEGPEYTPCLNCGHIEPQHAPDAGEGECWADDCECSAYRTEPDFEPPPQPDRRPPYAVAYSVQGHLYEVALPGDATVKAVDGALVIQHHLGPVAGIVGVVPVINEESA